MLLKKLFHQLVFFIHLVLLLGDIDFLWGMEISILTLSTFTVAPTSKSVELLVHSEDKSVE